MAETCKECTFPFWPVVGRSIQVTMTVKHVEFNMVNEGDLVKTHIIACTGKLIKLSDNVMV